MTIKQKLNIVSVIVITTLVTLSLTVFLGYRHVITEASLANDFDNESMYLQMMLRGLNEVIINEGSPASIQIENEGVDGFDKIHTRLMAEIKDPEIRTILIKEITPLWKVIKEEIKPFQSHYVDLEEDEMMINAGKVIVKVEIIVKHVKEFSRKKHVLLNRSSRLSGIIEKTIFITLLGMFLFSLFLTRHITYTIAHPIEELSNIARGFHKGDLTIMMDESRKDEFGVLAKYFNKSTLKLRDHSQNLIKINAQLKKEVVERKRGEESIKRMAYYDHLTQIPNRVSFLSHVNRSLQRSKHRSDYKFAVLFIDLDRFKIINDSLGHEIGDSLLVEVAHRLETFTRPTDKVSRIEDNDSAARFGGDEFALLLYDIKDISSASRVAERIQAELQEPIIIGRHELYTSASIGIALSATRYERAEDMLRDADAAMYRAKATGKAHAEIFDQEMHTIVTQMLQLESDLRIAVEEEQFMVYYQPIISAADMRIAGAEALVRWHHPERGFILPIDFIQAAEETGLISDIGEWVLRTACAQNKAWHDAGYPILPMAVNFSSRQFQDDNLVELVEIAIRETGMPAPLLDVEITEGVAMEEKSILILNQLTAMGVQTSIDDFGTGYSSLGSLTKFPINTIKIDRAFVKEMMIDVNVQAIIKAIIAMAHSLNMEVVAEGVETEDQLAYLQSQKCDKIQGYLFSPPVPEEDFRKLFEKEKNCSLIIQKHSKAIV